MDRRGIQIDALPELKSPVLIAAFDGWGNALQVATDTHDYLVQQFDGRPFARFFPDAYFRLDRSRPVVRIVNGVLEDLSWSGGTFCAARTGGESADMVLFRSDEPAYAWHHFTAETLGLCRRLKVQAVVTLGSMFDQVLHSDRIISGMASRREMRDRLKQEGLSLVSYHGPSAIHAVIQSEAEQADFECLSLWGHCPHYLQGTSHFGLLAALCEALSRLFGISISTAELEKRWVVLNRKIQGLVDARPDLREMITALRKQKFKGTTDELRADGKRDEKVIDIRDFFDSE